MRELILGGVITTTGAVLTAFIGTLLIPSLKRKLDRGSEQYKSSVALIDNLANNLWQYWTLALRVAFYGSQEQPRRDELKAALDHWDSDEAWQVSCKIRVLMSKSKRLLPNNAYESIDAIQKEIIEYFDERIGRLRDGGTPEEWTEFFQSLKDNRRPYINNLLMEVTNQLRVKRKYFPALKRSDTSGQHVTGNTRRGAHQPNMKQQKRAS